MQLLSESEKAQFFTQLDALMPVTSSRAQRPRTRPSDTSAESDAAEPGDVRQCEATKVLVAVEDPATTERKAIRTVSTTEQEMQDGRGRVLGLLRKRASADATAQQTKGKRKMQRKNGKANADPASKDTASVLQGRKVLVVPIGPDVSHKRVQIWQEMVEKLGGVNVMLSASGSDRNRRSRNIRHLSTEDKTALPQVGWEEVDYAVVSAQLEQEKARNYFHCEVFPPPAAAVSKVKVYTPEWLILLMREKQLPAHDDAFEWAHVKKLQVEAESHKKHLQEAEEAKAAARDEVDSPVEDEGSDIRNRSNQEIQRVPPVNLDVEKLKREEEELQAKKNQLVKERTPIFFASNPGFNVLAEGIGENPLVADTFVCQKSSSAYFGILAWYSRLMAWLLTSLCV